MKALKEYPISLLSVIEAMPVVRRFLARTNLTFYKSLSEFIGANIYIKHENHNPGGSFKIRGGVNLLYHVKQNGIKGVITFTTGNHGISIATASSNEGIAATIVVPENNNPTKNQLIRDAGARLIEAGKTFEEAASVVRDLSERDNLYYVHAANEPHLINGVGTEFLEIVEELPNIDVIILPIGAGSELAAAVTVFRAIKPSVEIVAVQSERSCAAYKSWKAGKIEQSENGTFAGGFATGSGYDVPFNIYGSQLAEFVLLSEEEIKESMMLAVKYTRNLAEGAGGSTIIAAYKIREKLRGKNVVLQMSGGNIEFDQFKEVMSRNGQSVNVRNLTSRST